MHYVCDYCGTTFKDPDNCKSCEDSHLIPIDMIRGDMAYKRPAESCKDNVPTKIVVSFARRGDILMKAVCRKTYNLDYEDNRKQGTQSAY